MPHMNQAKELYLRADMSHIGDEYNPSGTNHKICEHMVTA